MRKPPAGQEGQGGVAGMCLLQKGWTLLLWEHRGIGGAVSTPAVELCRLAFVLPELQPCTYGCLGLISPGWLILKTGKKKKKRKQLPDEEVNVHVFRLCLPACFRCV